MFAAHVGAADTAFDWSDPSSWPDLVNGRSAILFALCAGVSLVLLTTGPTGRSGPRPRHVLARAATLLAIGGLLTLVPGGVLVILPTYAVLFVAALPFLRSDSAGSSSPRRSPSSSDPCSPSSPGRRRHDRWQQHRGAAVHRYPAVSWFGIVLAACSWRDSGSTAPTSCAGCSWWAPCSPRSGTVPGPHSAPHSASPAGRDDDPRGPERRQRQRLRAGGARTPAGGPDVVADTRRSRASSARLLDVTPHAGSTFELVGALGRPRGARCPRARRSACPDGPAPAQRRRPSRADALLRARPGHRRVSRSGEPDPLPVLGGWGPFVVLLVAAVVAALLVHRSGRRGPLEALTDEPPEHSMTRRPRHPDTEQDRTRTPKPPRPRWSRGLPTGRGWVS